MKKVWIVSGGVFGLLASLGACGSGGNSGTGGEATTTTTTGSGGASTATTASSGTTGGSGGGSTTSTGTGTGTGTGGGGASAGLLIGANIHPVQGAPANDVAQMVADAQLIGFKHLRMDIYKTSSTTLMNQIITAANAAGIEVTVAVIGSPTGASSASQAYTDAHDLVQAIAKTAPKNRTWECGNEYNIAARKSGASGTSYSDYDATKIAKVREWLHGCIDAVHEVDAANRAIVNYSGYTDYGFMVGLWNGPQPDGGANLRWDISSIHHYNVGKGYAGQGSNCMGMITAVSGHDILQIIHQIGPPIWLTEFHDNGCHTMLDTNAMYSATGNVDFMTNMLSLKATYDVETIDMYQLYDQSDDAYLQTGFWTPNRGSLKTDFSGPVQGFFTAHGNPAN